MTGAHFQTLFGTRRERIDFLNQIAPVFFKMIFETPWSEILLHMTRITGPAVSRIGGNEFQNLTIKRLPALVDDVVRPTIEQRVETSAGASLTI